MSYAKEFYITLDSRDSKEYSPDNTQFNFYGKLPRNIELYGDWSVCVNQIWIDKMWYNIENTQIGLENDKGDTVYVYLTDGYYDNISALLNEINTKARLNNLQILTCIYNNITHKVSVSILNSYKVHFTFNLCLILGSEHSKITSDQILEKCVNLFFFEKILYIYTDMIHADIYSHTEPNVLKIISPSSYSFGDIIYDNIVTNYNRVSINSFDVIHVQIKNYLNNNIKDYGGSTTIQLHFKRETD